MAKIECTVTEFIELFGKKVTNETSKLAKPFKKELKRCENCFRKKSLQSAHIIHKDDMIKEVLSKYSDTNESISVNVTDMLIEIGESHKPVLDNFMFLCGKCHKKYDGKNNEDTEYSPKVELERIKELREHPKAYRIQDWAQKHENKNFKLIKVCLQLSNNGKEAVPLDQFREACTNIGLTDKQFKENFSSMKTDNGNSHGKVFQEAEDQMVSIYPVVLEEVLKHFNN